MHPLLAISGVLLIGVEISVSSVGFAQALPPPVAETIQAAQKQIKTIGMEEYGTSWQIQVEL